MILAAGRGTRLAPLTDTLPKVLVPVLGVPMLERLRAWLHRHGVTALAMNTHHLPPAVEEHLAQAGARGLPVRIFHEEALLGTGGALVNAAAFWGDDPLLVWNGDILCAVDPRDVMAAHQAQGGLATLVVQERSSASHLLVDSNGVVCGVDSPRRGGRRRVRDGEEPVRPLAFNGISILDPGLREALPSSGAFDLIDALLDLSVREGRVLGWNAGDAFYGTTGSAERLQRLERELQAHPDVLAEWSA